MTAGPGETVQCEVLPDETVVIADEETTDEDPEPTPVLVVTLAANGRGMVMTPGPYCFTVAVDFDGGALVYAGDKLIGALVRVAPADEGDVARLHVRVFPLGIPGTKPEEPVPAV